MNFEPLINAAQPIPIHGIAAIFCFFFGAAQFALPKGTTLHRWMGRIWIIGMLLVAGSSLFMRTEFWDFFYFRPIHGIAILGIYFATQGILAARRGEIAKHKIEMRNMYIFAILIPSALAFLPGRRMFYVLFG